MISEILWSLAKKVLFYFDPERIHRWVIRLIQGTSRLGHTPIQWISQTPPPPIQKPQVWGMQFNSRLGLAAGFDKDAEILETLPDLGFGFAEIGTVTPRPQPGNELPRLFRIPENRSLFNRMGFNGQGARVVSERVARAREKLPEHFRVGINLGKNKDTPEEEAGKDYLLSAQAFQNLADYLVINVSSPNTPGLRSLQTVEALKPIVLPLAEHLEKWKKRPPLLIKLAPEITEEALKSLIDGVEAFLDRKAIQGWVLTNTLAGEQGAQKGGLSGGVLTEISRQRLIEAKRITSLPVISVGGILTVEEALYRVRLGADLIQIYSGWIYEGPSFPSRIARALQAFEKQTQNQK